MGLSIGIAALLILALVFLFFRPKRAAPGKRPVAKRPVDPSATGEFHAVSLKITSGACSAAKDLKGKRFLSSAAPRIPLPDCDVLDCKCRFLHHKDRRDGDDRRDPYAPRIAGGTGTLKKDKRKRRERRKDSDPI
jgi:hypothetical protein